MAGSSSPVFAIEGAARKDLFASLRTTVQDFWALIKPEINVLIVIATFNRLLPRLSKRVHFPTSATA
jgi:hypothetical protein